MFVHACMCMCVCVLLLLLLFFFGGGNETFVCAVCEFLVSGTFVSFCLIVDCMHLGVS